MARQQAVNRRAADGRAAARTGNTPAAGPPAASDARTENPSTARRQAASDARTENPSTARRQTARARLRKRRAGNDDHRLGAGLFALGAGYLAAAFLISEPEGGYAAVGPRVFPIGVGIALAAVAPWIAFRGNGTAPDTRHATAPPDTLSPDTRRATAPPDTPAPGVSRPDTRRTTAPPDASPAPADWRAAAPSALLFLAYVVLLDPLGYLPATIGFITLEARLLGSRSPGRDLLAALVVTISVHALFSLLLGLRLPAGVLAEPFGLRLPGFPGGP